MTSVPDGDEPTPSQELGSLATMLSELARTGPATLAAGTLVADQYRIERPLGEGGMGVVFLARDVRLDREVAVKVCSGLSRSAVHRIQREAMALAKLAHPNVVVVFQAGEFDGRFFIAMEYVAGGTARSWLAAAPRSQRAIVDLYLEAGAGLAAAHAAGLVHRDFKPDNVLVGGDGRVRVADFGLAWTERDDAIAEVTPEPGAPALPRLSVDGAVAGTPAYMAPEQRRGEALDARADQYAFCVALWEALTGRRPGADDPAGPPAWLARVLRRGLEPARERRFSSMPALLAALRDDPRVVRRRWLVRGAVAVALGSSLAAAAGAFAGPPLCAAAGAPLAGVWDGPRRDAVAAAFARACAEDRACPPGQLARTVAALDRYAGAWALARGVACEATHVHGVQSAELLDRRMLCLDARLRALDALVDVLATADAGVVGEAPAIAARLPSLAACADPAHLMAQLEPPASPGLAVAVAGLRNRLAQAHALGLTGRATEAIATAQQALAEAAPLGYAPLRAEAEVELGEALWQVDPTASERHLQDAYFTATAHAHDEVAARAATSLVWTVGYVQSRPEVGEQWSRHALAETERRGADVGQRIDALMATAALYGEQGRHAEALALQDRAIALIPGDDDGQRHTVVNNRAATLDALGRYAEAQAAYEEVLAAERRLFGEVHPHMARTYSNLGLVRVRQGLPEQAVELQQKALEMVMAGPDATQDTRWDTLLNLGIGLTAAGRVDEALPALDEALALATRLLGPDHPHVALCLSARANALRDAGRHVEAVAAARAALALFERSYGPDHDEVHVQQSLLAQALVAAGAPEEALPFYAQAIAGWGREDAAHPRLAEAHVEQGDALLLLKRNEEAAEAYTRALAVASRSEVDADTRARATAGLARVR